MGLLRWSWLKKQKTHPSSNKRRQSEPPVVINGARQQQLHHSAINNFNTRVFDEHGHPVVVAHQQRPQQQQQQPSTSRCPAETSSNDGLDDDDQQQPPCLPYGPDVADGGDEPRSSHFSLSHTLPARIPKIFIGKKKQKAKKPVRSNSTIILENEVKEFERNHCGESVRLDARDVAESGRRSPPKQFFKYNLNPFPASASDALPKRLQRGCAPIKPLRSGASSLGGGSSGAASSVRSSGAYQRYDLRSSTGTSKPSAPASSTEEDEEPVAANSDDGSSSGICSGSEPMSDPQPRPSSALVRGSGSKLQRSVRYEHEVNKYGDLVEYAVLGEDKTDDGGVGLAVAATNDGSDDGLIEENFRFLNESQRSYVLSSKLPNAVIAVDGGSGRKPCVKVTDLDDSAADHNATINSLVQRSCGAALNVCPELDMLESWSDGLTQRSRMTGDFLDKHKSTVAACKAKDIKPMRHTRFGTRFKSQLPFSCGTFKHATVTLRKCMPRRSETVRLVEEAIERDYEILRSEIKHPSIAMLMAACYNKTMVNHMILVLEPCDFTLNYFLHQMNGNISVPDAITLVQQIAGAAQYLHEFGVIHTNISSHCVLVCKRNADHHLNAKLSSFELATAVNVEPIRRTITSSLGGHTETADAAENTETMTKPHHHQSSRPVSSASSGIYSCVKPRRRVLQDKYRERSKLPIADDAVDMTDHSYLAVPSEYLGYNVNFRRHLVMFNYQAPELLGARSPFVFPTIAADVYGLTLMLWELLNMVVPYVVYTSPAALVEVFERGEWVLPQMERQRCRHFGDLFALGLESLPERRKLGMAQLLQQMRTASEQYERLESVLDSNDDTLSSGVGNGGDLSDAEDCDLAVVNCTPTQPQITPEIRRAPQHEQLMMLAQSKLQHPSTCSALNKSTSGSLFDVQLIANHGEGRTSTIKKRRRVSRSGNNMKSAVALFSSEDATSTATDSVGTADEQDDVIAEKSMQALDADQSARLVSTPFYKSVQNMSTKSMLTAEKSRFLNELLDSYVEEPDAHGLGDEVDRASKSLCDIIADRSPGCRKDLNKSAHNATTTSSSGYRFEIGNVTLPKTPIARENTIRRYSWLSERQLRFEQNSSDDEVVQTKTITTPGASEQRYKPVVTTNHFVRDGQTLKPILKTPETLDRSKDHSIVTITHDPLANRAANKPLNVSIKIVHNRVSPSPTTAASGSGWSFGAKRVRSCEKYNKKPIAGDDIATMVNRKPTRLSYTESMLKKDPPVDGKVAPIVQPLPCQAPALRTCTDISAEFNTLLANTTDANVTKDFLTIVREMEAVASTKVQRKESAVVRPTERAVRPKESVSTHQSLTNNTTTALTSPAAATAAPPNSQNASVEIPQHTPIKETIMQFENWLAMNKTQSPFNTTTGSRSVRMAPDSLAACVMAVVSTSTPASTATERSPGNKADVPVQATPEAKNVMSQESPAPHTLSQKTTIIKRTIFTESIVSSVNASSGSAVTASVASGGGSATTPNRRQQRTTQVNLNMTHRQSVDGVAQKLVQQKQQQLMQQHEIRHSVCGNESALLAGDESARKQRGMSDDVVANVANKLCGDCANIVSHDQMLKVALSCTSGRSDIARNSDVFQLPRGSITGSRQTMRSMEDFYIDDDFAHINNGLAANIDLVSDTSDLFADLFDYKEEDAEQTTATD